MQIHNKFNSSKKVEGGVHQGSIDRPFLFNLLIKDLTLFLKTILSNYAHENNLTSRGNNFDFVNRTIREILVYYLNDFTKII